LATKQPYSALVVSGVVPPPLGTDLAQPIIQNVGRIVVVKAFEVETNGQLLRSRSYVGSDECMSVVQKLMADLPCVMENPEHLKQIRDWFKKMGSKVSGAYRKIDGFQQKITGKSIATQAREQLTRYMEEMAVEAAASA